MSATLDNFKVAFSNTYQEHYQKRAVGKVVANFRFEKELKYGVSVDRDVLDASGVRIRTIVPNVDRTVDTLTDSKETLTINRIKGYTFSISDYEMIQAGPLKPAVTAGARVAKELALYVDGDILAEILNLTHDFDNGDLTTMASSGAGITLSGTTVPQMVARMPAKNSYKNNQDNEGTILIIDSYAASDIAQYVMGKNIDLAGSTFKNGYSGTVGESEVRVSEKLTSEAVLTAASTFSNGETIVINGVALTMVSSIGSTAGNVLIGASADASVTNIAALINTPGTTTAEGIALSAANQVLFTDTLRLAATASIAADTVTIVGTGSGRLILSETCAQASFTSNVLHAYYGKPGFTDVVMQDEVDMDYRMEPKQRTTNWLGDKMYGVKTFTDGKVRGLDVLLNA